MAELLETSDDWITCLVYVTTCHPMRWSSFGKVIEVCLTVSTFLAYLTSPLSSVSCVLVAIPAPVGSVGENVSTTRRRSSFEPGTISPTTSR